MNVIVTGAAGLVGQFVVAKLVELGSPKVIAQSRSFSGLRSRSTEINLVELDLLGGNAVQELVSFAPDVIVHCAAQIPMGTISFQDSAQINQKIDENILNVAQRCGSKVVFISSAGVYEDAALPWRESQPVFPRTAYAREKLSSEELLSGLAVPGVSLRITSPYGGLQNSSRNVLYKFLYGAISNQPLSVYGSGARCQNFVFAGDIADAVALVIVELESSIDISGVFNIAGDNSTSMKDLATVIVELVGKGEIVYSGKVDTDEHFKSEIDITKAQEILGWVPKTKLKNGIQSLVNLIEG